MGFFSKIKEGLKKSSNRLTEGFKTLPPPVSEAAPEPVSEAAPLPKEEHIEKTVAIEKKEEKQEGLKKKSAGGFFAKFKGRSIAAEDLQTLEELLISADMGAKLAAELCKNLADDKPKIENDEDLRLYLADKITQRLIKNNAHGFPSVETIRAVKENGKEKGSVFVMLVMGANGCGKTTSIAKLAQHYSGTGLKVLLAAGDLFRAAGSEQLAIWGERLGIDVVSAEQGGSSSGLTYEAHAKALMEGYDLLIIDTAGRLHNKSDLMAELGKLDRVIKKQDGLAPHCVLLVLDGTGGKHILDQAVAFNEVLPLTHLLMTKLDSTAKGGILLALVESMDLPIMAIGVGEGADDLLPFDAKDFAYGLLGLDMSEGAEGGEDGEGD